MSGNWARSRRSRTHLAAICLLVCGLVAAIPACQTPPRRYDGEVKPPYSRLVVANKTPWKCSVSIEPSAETSQGGPCTRTTATLLPDEEFVWDLHAGSYTLNATKLEEPVSSFSKVYEAEAGQTRVWPLLDRSYGLNDD